MEFSLLNPTRVIAPEEEASSTALPSPLLSNTASLLVLAFDRLYPPEPPAGNRLHYALINHGQCILYGPPLGIRAIINYHRHAILVKKNQEILVCFALPIVYAR